MSKTAAPAAGASTSYQRLLGPLWSVTCTRALWRLTGLEGRQRFLTTTDQQLTRNVVPHHATCQCFSPAVYATIT